MPVKATLLQTHEIPPHPLEGRDAGHQPTIAEFSVVESPDGALNPTMVFGDMTSAEIIVAETVFFGARITDPTQIDRFASHQEVLGKKFCVVATQVFDPVLNPFSREQQRVINGGSFVPFAERFASVIEGQEFDPDQELRLLGYSQAGDVAVQTVHSALHGKIELPSRVTMMGAMDFARTKDRWVPRMMGTFALSAPNMYENIVSSGSPALMESMGIDPSKRFMKQRHLARAVRETLAWGMVDVLGMYRLVNGFGTVESLIQVNEIVAHPDGPDRTTIGVSTEAQIFHDSGLELLVPDPKLAVIGFKEDHSACYTGIDTELLRRSVA